MRPRLGWQGKSPFRTLGRFFCLGGRRYGDEGVKHQASPLIKSGTEEEGTPGSPNGSQMPPAPPRSHVSFLLWPSEGNFQSGVDVMDLCPSGVIILIEIELLST